ncbi:hypothetical protein KTR9_4833 (plasmid) [Gordonia sp. KTR9]|nr:hypothetical protein KTR9_4833 [Gordonia sp. KTR9]
MVDHRRSTRPDGGIAGLRAGLVGCRTCGTAFRASAAERSSRRPQRSPATDGLHGHRGGDGVDLDGGVDRRDPCRPADFTAGGRDRRGRGAVDHVGGGVRR